MRAGVSESRTVDDGSDCDGSVDEDTTDVTRFSHVHTDDSSKPVNVSWAAVVKGR